MSARVSVLKHLLQKHLVHTKIQCDLLFAPADKAVVIEKGTSSGRYNLLFVTVFDVAMRPAHFIMPRIKTTIGSHRLIKQS